MRFSDRPFVQPALANVQRRREHTCPQATYPVQMSNAANHDEPLPYGTTLLARDLTPDELLSAPSLASIETLVIEDLPADEDDAFAAALDS